MMSTATLIILAVLFFLTSVVGVVTGSNSLITVPVMFQFGIPEKEAVATNMFGLVFMAIGGTIPFVRKGAIDFRRTSPLVVMTIVSSAIGAALVGYITDQSIKLIVSVAMIVVALFTLVRQNGRSDSPHLEGRELSRPSGITKALVVGYVATFLLGIYGGLYSGGYVTILTAVFVAFLGMNFVEAIAATKWINVFSSSVATIIFMWQGLVNYKLGILLGVTMFVGAYVGAHYAARMNETWLQRIFLATVFILALKTLFDFI
ncbi:MAG: sulfite exporter TauE/SafE family protein [Acidobacteriota bacterium]